MHLPVQKTDLQNTSTVSEKAVIMKFMRRRYPQQDIRLTKTAYAAPAVIRFMQAEPEYAAVSVIKTP